MNRQQYKLLLRTEQENIRRGIPAKSCSTNSIFLKDMIDRNHKLLNVMYQQNMDDGIRWIFGFSNYVNALGNSPLNQKQNRRLLKGQIIRVDLFGHFGSEFTYDHIAIVLKAANSKGALIAPITSSPAKWQNNSNNPFFIPLNQDVPDLGGMKKNSTILLEHIRFVDRHRLLDIFGRVSNNEKLDEIENALAQMMSPNVIKKIQQLETEVLNLTTLNTSQNLKIDELEKKNAELSNELV